MIDINMFDMGREYISKSMQNLKLMKNIVAS